MCSSQDLGGLILATSAYAFTVAGRFWMSDSDRRHQVVLFAFDGLPVGRGDAEVRKVQ
jgi:hypothetical protein